MKGILRAVEESLQRLHITSVEMLLLHDPDEYYRQALDVAFPTLVELRRQEVVKAIGAGMNQWRMLADFARFADPDCLLLAGQYTLLEQEALAEFLPLCQTRGISVLLAGVFNGGILASGAVAGAYYKYAPASDEVLTRVQQLEQICAQYQIPLAAAALQFPLANPAVTALVIGAESPAEVVTNRAALHTPIPSACFHWLVPRGTIEHNPFERVVFPKVGRPLIQTITTEEFEKLLLACAPPNEIGAFAERAAVRNRAILWLLYELINLRLVSRTRGLEDVCHVMFLSPCACSNNMDEGASAGPNPGNRAYGPEHIPAPTFLVYCRAFDQVILNRTERTLFCKARVHLQLTCSAWETARERV